MKLDFITKGNFNLDKTKEIYPHENNLRFHIKIDDKYYEYAIDNINKKSHEAQKEAPKSIHMES